MTSLDVIARRHLARLTRAQSFTFVHLHYRAAKKAVGPLRGGRGVTETERIAVKAAHARKVSAEFHRRLKRAGIRVEVAR